MSNKSTRIILVSCLQIAIGALTGLYLLPVGWAQSSNNTCSNPVSKPTMAKPDDDSLRDNPAGRASWFLAGRKPSTLGLAGGAIPPPTARKLLQAYQQAGLLPGRPGLAGGPVMWQPVGPTPQKSLYWGNVSGRVTALAVDNRNNNLYVGTAFGGLWKTTDYLATSPQFLPIGDTSWPSLAVGSIAIDTEGSPSQPPAIYVGTGEANDSLDSYYGVGILKSTDGGLTWALTTGTGGLTPLSSTAQYNYDGPFVGASVSKILIDPADRQHLLAAVSNSPLGIGRSPLIAIYQSPDAGKTWQKTTAKGVSTYNTTDLVYEPGQKVFYSAIEGLGVFRLKQGSIQWESTSSVFGSTPATEQNFYRASLSVRSAGGNSEVYALVSSGYYADKDPRNYNLSTPGAHDTGMAKSIDGGLSWTPIAAPAELFGSGQGFYDQWIVSPSEATGIVAGGIDIWSSSGSSGAAWSNVSQAYDWAGGLAHPEHHIHPDQHAVVAIDATHWIVGNDGGIWSTDNGGTTWTDLNTNISSIQLMSVTPLSGSPTGFIAGSQDNGTTRLGIAGQPWLTTLTGDGGYTNANPTKPLQYFTERFNVSLCRSDDSGVTWTTVVDDGTVTGDSPFYVPYRLIRGSKDQIILGTQVLWRGDAMPATPGSTWQVISGILAPNGFVQGIASAPASPRIVYVSTSDSLIYVNTNVNSSNAALHWSSIRKPNLPSDRSFSAIAVSPTDSKVAYLAIQGFGVGHLFRTDNMGQSWLDITPTVIMDGAKVQIDTPVNSVLVDPIHPSNVYIATDTGVFATTDRGASWSPHGVGLPRTAILELKMSDDRRIIAATHGRGAWVISPLVPSGARPRQ